MKEDKSRKYFFSFLLSFVVFLLFTSLLWAEKFRSSSQNFYFVLPANWQEIPSDVLASVEKSVKQSLSRYSPAFKNIEYQYAFQPQGKSWFRGAYLLIREVNKQITIERLKRAFDFNSQRRTPIKGIEFESFKDFASDLRKKVVNSNTLIFFRREKMFLISSFVKFKEAKDYFSLTAVFLGKDSYVTLYFYFPQDDLNYLKDAKDILLSFHMRHPYSSKTSANPWRFYSVLVLIAVAASVFYIITKAPSR